MLPAASPRHAHARHGLGLSLWPSRGDGDAGISRPCAVRGTPICMSCLRQSGQSSLINATSLPCGIARGSRTHESSVVKPSVTVAAVIEQDGAARSSRKTRPRACASTTRPATWSRAESPLEGPWCAGRWRRLGPLRPPPFLRLHQPASCALRRRTTWTYVRLVSGTAAARAIAGRRMAGCAASGARCG